MSNDSPVLTSLTENSTDLPQSAGGVGNYVVLLVLLCVFAGGTLILLSVLLLFCHRCCVGSRRYSRASDDPEKTNTSYVEDARPMQDSAVRLNESDALSASSCHDEESDRFMSNYSTARRVSFNESALYDKESKSQDKGRRYTLTEGDFHHLKKARLTHLHLAPPSSALKILTIMECESIEGSSLSVNNPPAPKLYPLFQSSEMPAWLRQSSSGALPGDTHHSVLADPGVCLPGRGPLPPPSRAMEALGDKTWDRTNRERERCMSGTEGTKGWSLASGHHDSVLQLFCKMTRHASLEGAGPYFRRWKFNRGHRATSLDAKGSPKRRPFQRQRAASDNTDPTEDSPHLHLSPPLCHHNSPSLPPTHGQIGGIQRLSAGLLAQPPSPPSPPLSRYPSHTGTAPDIGPGHWLGVEVMVEAASGERELTHPPPESPETQDREQEMGGARGTCLWTEAGTETEAPARTEAAEKVKVWVGSEEEPDEEEAAEQRACKAEERMDRETKTANGCGAASQSDGAGSGAVRATEKEAEARLRLESVEAGTPRVKSEVDAELRPSEVGMKADSGTAMEGSGSGVYISQQEMQPSLYRDIWSLRASLEQYASSDQSSTDRESIRSDADSVCSVGGAAGRSSFAACLSQDLGDEPEGEWEFGDMEREQGGGDQRETDGDEEYGDAGKQIGHRGNRERQSGEGGGGDVEAGGRKLLQMDSGYTSIEAPTRAPEELRLFGTPGGPRGKTASERRLFFTSSGRKGSVCESFEAKVFQEELEDDMGDDREVKDKPMRRSAGSLNGGQLAVKGPSQSPSQLSPQPVPSPRPVRLRRRDYSIDEKTDALFNEFLRHDPRFDQQESPLRSRHRSRTHLRKQWQRHKQYSDPGSGGRYSPSLERQSFRPLWRGDSAGYLLDARYHSSLSRIASAADEEANEGASEGMTNEGSAGGSEGTACEGAVGQSPGVKEPTNTGSGNEIVANEDASSQSPGTLRARDSGMDPSVDNYNNNSSQALNYSSGPIANLAVVLPEQPPTLKMEDPVRPSSIPHLQPPSPSLSDKLSVSLEDRLYTGLWRTGPGQGGPECVLGARSSTPEPSSPL